MLRETLGGEKNEEAGSKTGFVNNEEAGQQKTNCNHYPTSELLVILFLGNLLGFQDHSPQFEDVVLERIAQVVSRVNRSGSRIYGAPIHVTS